MYPDWEPPMSSNRSRGMDAPNLSDGILGPAPLSGQTSGLSSRWGGGAGMAQKNTQGQNTRARVVVVKYDRKPLSDKSLFNFVEPFGRLREHLLLKNKGFLEMSTHDEALDVVNYYQQNPATLGGRPLVFELSKRLFIEKTQSAQPPPRPVERSMNRKRFTGDETPGVSQVVYFSNLPREEEKKKDLLTIAGRFGTVEKHLFLQKEGFIQLSSPREAEMMEKYYSMNPLEVRGQQVRCNVCTKYKTLNVPQQSNIKSSGSQGSRGPRPARSSSPRRSTDRKRSPSPKPRPKTERRKEERPKAKAESTSKPKPETKPESKPDSKSESKSESKAGPEKEESCSEEERTSMKHEPENAEGEEEQKASNGDERSEDTAEEEGGDGEKVKGAESEETKDSIMADAEEGVEGQEDEDFLENMDDMVVVDEIEDEDGADAIDNSEKGGMRVVLVMGFKKGYNHLNELMQLAQPFGKVVRHLVLNMQHKAYLQFSTEEEAVAMAKFYNGNVQATVCGRPVKIWHYTAQPTIQFGFVVYIGKLPDAKYKKEEVLELVEKFGKVRKYFLHYIRRECFIEMETEEQAERAVEHYRRHPAILYGSHLTIYVSRKYRVLRGRHVVVPGSKKSSKREKDSTPKRRNDDEEPPAKKARDERAEKKGERKEERKEEEAKEGGDEDTPMEDLSEETKEETSKEVVEEESKEETSKEGGDEEIAKEGGDEESDEETSKVDGTAEMKGEESDKEQPEEREEERKEESLIEEEERSEGKEEEDRLLEKTEDKRLDQDSDQDQSEEDEMETNQEPPQPETPPSECEATPLDSEAPPPDTKPAVASLPLPPYDPNTPLGVEHVKMGYYCRVCFLFYSNEDSAKRIHCSSQAHYDKLQKFLEKKKTSPK
ncbi:matrin 3-like 1.2 isoform X2 [Boleophthalmus pectinirostris]|nr:matrin 3-like 1.2 isoform X2 [Boleophthalmus pectinirostris]